MKWILVLAVLTLVQWTNASAPVYFAREDVAIPNKYMVFLEKDADLQSIKMRIKSFSFIAEFGWEYKGMNGFVVTIDNKGLNYMRDLDEVRYIEQDQMGHKDAIASWGLDRTDQRTLPLDDVFVPEGDGAGANVFVLDTGITYAHTDFEGRAKLFRDMVNPGNPSETDCDGHGTHCAGTVGGATYGVAKKVNLWNTRVLNCFGSGPASDVAAGMTEVADFGDRPAAISMSLSYVDSVTIDDAATYCFENGVSVVTSSGNDDADACFKSPQRNNRTIAVGATDDTDTRAYFSNYGPCQDIYAPGVDIVSCDNNDLNGSSVKSGTSMSCPHVAGVAAIKLGIKPEMSPGEVKTTILADSTPGVVNDAKEEEDTPNKLLYSAENI
ncbi:extracellular serine proteinase-like [Saccoglossus kowalevskii]